MSSERWIGNPHDPPLATERHFQIASGLVALTGVSSSVLTSVFVAMLFSTRPSGKPLPL